MEPSIGRIVHYRTPVGDIEQCWAAVVTAPSTPSPYGEPGTPPAATLTLLPPGAAPQPLTDPVAYDTDRAYAWHWATDHDVPEADA